MNGSGVAAKQYDPGAASLCTQDHTVRVPDNKRPSAGFPEGRFELELATDYRLLAWRYYRCGRPGGVSLLNTLRFFSM